MVSICIPTYNYTPLFKRCLESVLIQDFNDYEIIVSDDSDDDTTKNYVEGLKLNSLKYYRNKPGLGSPLNWNNCLMHAERKYVKIMHHDDYFASSSALSKFVHALENNPKASFAFCYSHIYFKNQNNYFVHRQTSTQLKRLDASPHFLFYRNVIGAPSVTFFKSDMAILFNKHYKWLVDVEFYIRYFKAHPGFVAIPEALVTIVDGEEGQATTSVSKNRRLVISENLNLFSTIYSSKLDQKKSYLFFQELFLSFDINNYEALSSEVAIPENLQDFMLQTFRDLKKNTLLKKLKKRLLTSRYNKLIFKIERF